MADLATSRAFRRGFENASAGRGSSADPMVKISTSIIAFNQADKIEDAIKSVLWTDEIVLADSHSTDGTADIAERLGARVVQIPLFVIAFGNFEGTFYRYAKRYEEIKAWRWLTVEPLRKPDRPVTK